MIQQKSIMGMPIIIEIADSHVQNSDFTAAFERFRAIDQKFSTYKKDSEISQINDGKISQSKISREMRLIFILAEKTKRETNGYFNIMRGNTTDPSGVVKGWAILEVTKLLKKRGFKNFYVNAGGDIQTCGLNSQGKPWQIGIRNPFDKAQVIKILNLQNKAIATSGTYERGNHIYNPHGKMTNNIKSISVVAGNILDADRIATAVFAMGEKGIQFLEKFPKLEGYMINAAGIATMTSGFEKYVESY